jgi:hypothetical protein
MPEGYNQVMGRVAPTRFNGFHVSGREFIHGLHAAWRSAWKALFCRCPWRPRSKERVIGFVLVLDPCVDDFTLANKIPSGEAPSPLY